MPFLHSVRNCKVYRRCYLHKKIFFKGGGGILKAKNKIQILLLLSIMLLS